MAQLLIKGTKVAEVVGDTTSLIANTLYHPSGTQIITDDGGTVGLTNVNLHSINFDNVANNAISGDKIHGGTISTSAAVFEGSSANAIVRITQTGAGNALVVEDSANPNSTHFVVTSDGRVGIGLFSQDSAMLQVENTANGRDADVKIFKASGDNSDIAALYVGYDENACLKIYRSRADGNIYIDHTQNDNLRFQFGGANRYILNNIGFYPDDNDARNLGTSSQRWANVYTNDLHLSNMTKENGNDVDGTKGDWTIQEGIDALYMINNITGKKYKINMTEVE